MQKKTNPVEYVFETQRFAGVVVNAPDGVNKVLKILSPDWYRFNVNKFKTGEQVILKMTNKKVKRSEAQNNYYWGVYLPAIVEETGEGDIESLHLLFKGKFLTKEVVVVMGEKVRRTKSTTSLSKRDFNDYIRNIEAYTGIKAPPTQNWLGYDLSSFPQVDNLAPIVA